MYIKTFRETLAVNPLNLVSNLKARILNRHDHAVVRARAAETKQMPAGLQHAQSLTPHVNARHAIVPTLPHERQSIGRIGDDAINR